VTYSPSSWPVHKPIPGGGVHAHNVKLAIKTRTEVLSGVPLFAGLSKRQLQDIARGSISRRWPDE